MKPMASSTVVTRRSATPDCGVQPRLHLGVRELLRLPEGVEVLIVRHQGDRGAPGDAAMSVLAKCRSGAMRRTRCSER